MSKHKNTVITGKYEVIIGYELDAAEEKVLQDSIQTAIRDVALEWEGYLARREWSKENIHITKV